MVNRRLATGDERRWASCFSLWLLSLSLFSLSSSISFDSSRFGGFDEDSSEASRRVPTVVAWSSSVVRRPSFVVRRSSSSLQQRRPASSVQPPSRLVPASPTPSSSFVSFQRHLIWSSSVVPAGWVFISSGSSTTTTTPSWVFNISPFSNLTFAIHPSFGFHLRYFDFET
ncbi:hypothetical protein LWI29_014841 [Acer saccharum]|uniref:Uncharacterized protein n=1 Tax=Acer saccharum TaxID=4024 RepID=A0AA39VIA8_ACESA|nr:hypothetical protein LWI29_014841 [Acer saccharum]